MARKGATTGGDDPRTRKIEEILKRIPAGAPSPSDVGADQRKVQTLIGSFFARKEGGLAREFEISDDAGGSITLSYYNQMLAPLGITMSLGKFGLSLTDATGKSPQGVTVQDTLVSRSGHTPKFAAIMVMQEEPYMLAAAACGYNASSKLPAASRERWEAIKAEAAKKNSTGQSGGQSHTP